jgi:segregation and condensation protein A
MTEQTDYRVQLDAYHGPLDLLLFLIQREEIDICDIPIAEITRQYLAYIEILRDLDPEVVSEFLVLAATLMEIKSRLLLPVPPPEENQAGPIDPRQDLVRQLLAYKHFKDAARLLESAADLQAQKHPRQPAELDLPPDETELDHVDVWDLLHAFKKLMEQVGKVGPLHRVTVDDTPIALHAEDILDSIERAGGSQKFEDIFVGRGKAEMIGLFLALLELIRQKRIRASQDRPFGTILIHLLEHKALDEGDAFVGVGGVDAAEAAAFVTTTVTKPVSEVFPGDDDAAGFDSDGLLDATAEVEPDLTTTTVTTTTE